MLQATYDQIVYELPHDKTNNNECAPSEHLDQPGHPPSPISLRSWVLSYPVSAQLRLGSDWVDAQADWSLCWGHMSFC